MRCYVSYRMLYTVMLVGGVIVTDAATALAQAPPTVAPSNTDSERAKAFFRQGNEAFRKGDFAGAVTAYRQAYALRPAYDTAGSLGEALLKVGNYAEAATYLAECLRELPATVSSSLRERMADAFEQAKKEVGTLNIEVNVESAEVLIDDQLVGKSPLPNEVFVEPGTHTLVARLGSKTASGTITVDKATSQDITLKISTGPNMSFVLAGGIAGGALLISGITFAILSNAKSSDAEVLPRGSPERADLRDSQTVLGNISFWSFIASGAALGATGVYVLTTLLETSPASKPPQGFYTAPIITPHGGGLMVKSTF